MGEIKGFLKVKRQAQGYRPVCQRLKDYQEVALLTTEENAQKQASRCMDCGTPFCHWGCPIGNYIPEWNDLIFCGHWEKAWQLLEATNGLAEITGRLCPAPCEYSCVLGINDEAVTIRENELAIIEYAFKHNLIKPYPPRKRTGKRVAVIGSGPAGLSCAQKLNRLGHQVVVFEREAKIGGILRYGIPDFKLPKGILDRRLNIWQKEGIEFNPGINVGRDYPVKKLFKEFDALCLAGGCYVPRDLTITGRNLKGIHLAMDYLTRVNKRVAGEKISLPIIDAKGKRVVVIGGGDTGADCLGTAHRQGASRVVQIELLPKPPECRTCDYPWPKYPLLLKTSSSYEEGGVREWSVLTKKFIGENGYVKKLACVRVDFERDLQGAYLMKEVAGSEFEIEADLVILALGFLYPQREGPIHDLGLKLDSKGNVKTDANFMTSKKSVFSVGDMRRGQSLVVWAIAEGKSAASAIDRYLSTEKN